ncbi:hypothetical protein [Pseudoalteromonas luteoviolacea]|uniref:Uncharacterized protein n=1 Tax=Pseudoalteromonas luteoviolacea S4054 TaxID=1129367 RepID=A0A0F6AG31_9GAMM|nr:hypothetical protein [Pseudoalteromonas luteoviolacea]AOT09366.1 hypothetical protein S4054249_16585 [Pseudoalteromonas luteoviolacea]AOT14278.1 hypothetical protein S40542_16555 [Pseudoalteromonas luteoviolacea]AOT19194.1 hypothetical protein S4054_16560 [Pseudoalteromonas luteoviolacea]KKE85170.1 hypothetical protein N479_26235 [Pseudoalteromonas luteoviolacea S4054]KZN73466.1 hypothetical protein N481_12155 [Pseudoalteromonas luteoviolacea S4047-1]
MENLIAEAQSAAVEEKIALENARINVRHKISNRIADTDSMLGNTSDISHILLHELSIFVNKLSTANSLAEMRTSTESLKNAIGAIEGKVASGEVELPYQVKGQEAALEEAVVRAHGVSSLLK